MIVFDISVHCSGFLWPFHGFWAHTHSSSRVCPVTIHISTSTTYFFFLSFAFWICLIPFFSGSSLWLWFDSHARLIVPLIEERELVLHWFISPRTKNHRSYHQFLSDSVFVVDFRWSRLFNFCFFVWIVKNPEPSNPFSLVGFCFFFWFILEIRKKKQREPTTSNTFIKVNLSISSNLSH